MQKEICPSDGGSNTNSTTTSSPLPSSHQNSLLSPDQPHDNNQFTSFTSSFPSIFPPNSVSITPSDCSFDDDTNHSIATENRLYQARYVLEYQDLYNRYTLCLAHFHEALKDVDDLLQENANLRLANKDLTNRLSLLSQASIQNCFLSSGYPSLSFINDFHRLSVGTNARDSHVTEEVSDVSPTSVIQSNRFEDGRVSLPKSISVRSSGYLKVSQPGPSRNPVRHRVTSPVPNESQRVYVPGRKREEEALEFEVYNQGMFKTELCNKWQETGTCPYGDHCQFAHGITELRPVIRHPRYKTEVCRMVLSGDTCPYGHRCHFRHTLTEQERLLGSR